MTSFYDRRFELLIDDKVVMAPLDERQFRVVFEIKIDTGGYISFADIAIYNLSQDTVSRLFKSNAVIKFRAGYVGTIDTIFIGRIRNILKERDGPDVITRLIARGGSLPKTASVERSLGEGVRVTDIIRTCVAAIGYPIVIQEEQFSSIPAYPRGYTLHGDPRAYLDELARTHDFSYVIDNDRIVINKNDSFRPGSPIVVSKENGMEGIPEISEVGCDVRTRLNPKIKVYGRIDIRSIYKSFNFGNLYFQDVPDSAGYGVYRVYQITHSGDSWGDDWSTQITGWR